MPCARNVARHIVLVDLAADVYVISYCGSTSSREWYSASPPLPAHSCGGGGCPGQKPAPSQQEHGRPGPTSLPPSSSRNSSTATTAPARQGSPAWPRRPRPDLPGDLMRPPHPNPSTTATAAEDSSPHHLPMMACKATQYCPRGHPITGGKNTTCAEKERIQKPLYMASDKVPSPSDNVASPSDLVASLYRRGGRHVLQVHIPRCCLADPLPPPPTASIPAQPRRQMVFSSACPA